MLSQKYDIGYLKYDIPAGIIVALVSIPIAIGYALISGLPPVYGLYGSIFPIFFYGLITSSPRFVFGVDAAPAALTGGIIYSMGIAFQSQEALEIVPVITLFTAFWLILFRIVGAGRFVKFISSPVMGGFITGIGCTIILMQIPKLFGGEAGRGELPELLTHIVEETNNVNMLSLVVGIGTILTINIFKRIMPKIPVSAVMMFGGAGIQLIFHVDKLGVKLLPKIPPGMPEIIVPDVSMVVKNSIAILLPSLVISIVILSETLLATHNYAMKHDDKIDSNREIIAYAAGNIAAAFTGCCPVNGSVSRTGIVDQFGVKSQVMSLVASLTMVLMLIFGTGFISMLPVPILTGIVIAALMGILEFDLARKLRKVDKAECVIFYLVFAAVLLFGTVWGVVSGVLLSFITVIIRAARPPREFLGCIPGIDGFYPLGRNRAAKPIEKVLIYRFKGSLFFANIGEFQNDIENAVNGGNITVVVVEASGIGSVDITAAERLLILYEKLKTRGIEFFLTEHAGAVNDQLRIFGAERMISEGACRRHMEQALESIGIFKPYNLIANENDFEKSAYTDGMADKFNLAEFEWAFGSEADEKMTELASKLASNLMNESREGDSESALQKEMEVMKRWSSIDEDIFLDALEMQFALIVSEGRIEIDKMIKLERELLEHHANLDAILSERDDETLRRIIEQRVNFEEAFRNDHPEAYEALLIEREEHREFIRQEAPKLLNRIDAIRRSISLRHKV